MSRRFAVRVVFVVLIGAFSATGVVRVGARQDDDAPSYTAVDLGTIKGYPGTALFALNANGVIVGQGFETTTYQSRAVIYRNEKIRALIKGEKGVSSAQDINASNQIVGYTVEDGLTKATLWDGDEATVLVEGPGSSLALAINDEGAVASWASESAGALPRPFVWVDGELSYLPFLEDGDRAAANNINAEGVAVGFSLLRPEGSSGTVPSHATAWVDGKATDLGTVGGDYSQALGINASGQIVGRSTTGPDQEDRGPGTHATLWDGDEVVDLGALAEGDTSVAAAINAQSEIVGQSAIIAGDIPVNGHALYWRDGTLYDLNELIDGGGEAVLYYAYDINDDGLIVAIGRVDGIDHAFLLTPIEA
jgi:probable HAF family extracellular repeat protein